MKSTIVKLINIVKWVALKFQNIGAGGIKKGWHKVLKKWGGVKEGGIRFLGGGIKRGWHKNFKKNGKWHKKGGVKKKTNVPKTLRFDP